MRNPLFGHERHISYHLQPLPNDECFQSEAGSSRHYYPDGRKLCVYDILRMVLRATIATHLFDYGEDRPTTSISAVPTDPSQIISLSVGCAIVSASPRTRTPAWRPYRAAMFIALGLSAFVPILHGVNSHGVAGMNLRITLFPWLALEGVCYLLGACLYAVSRSLPTTPRPDHDEIFH
jgi:Haemolysin-III related